MNVHQDVQRARDLRSLRCDLDYYRSEMSLASRAASVHERRGHHDLARHERDRAEDVARAIADTERSISYLLRQV